MTRRLLYRGRFVDLNVSPGHRWLRTVGDLYENRSQLWRYRESIEAEIFRRLVRRFLLQFSYD